VRQAAAFIVTNRAGIQEVWAAVVCRKAIEAEDLRAHCRLLMPLHFISAHIMTLDALPVNAMGKVIRPRLNELATGVVHS
jgi:acyl-CoA synthetase (AMP-forming)/AMP-acid ligase II